MEHLKRNSMSLSHKNENVWSQLSASFKMTTNEAPATGDKPWDCF